MLSPRHIALLFSPSSPVFRPPHPPKALPRKCPLFFFFSVCHRPHLCSYQTQITHTHVILPCIRHIYLLKLEKQTFFDQEPNFKGQARQKARGRQEEMGLLLPRKTLHYGENEGQIHTAILNLDCTFQLYWTGPTSFS